MLAGLVIVFEKGWRMTLSNFYYEVFGKITFWLEVLWEQVIQQKNYGRICPHQCEVRGVRFIMAKTNCSSSVGFG